MNIHARNFSKSLTTPSTLLAIALSFSSAVSGEETNPKDVIEKDFWGKQYNSGGTTFYCQEDFNGKSPLVSESYIYQEAAIRSALECGSKRSCLRDSEKYRQITSDLHNIVPANAFFELKRRGTVFGALEESESETVCGMRKRMHIIEPPDDVKGDIARVIFYMHDTYELPILGSRLELEDWARKDPLSQQELERHEKIEKIQGSASSHWLQPETTASLLKNAIGAVN